MMLGREDPVRVAPAELHGNSALRHAETKSRRCKTIRMFPNIVNLFRIEQCQINSLDIHGSAMYCAAMLTKELVAASTEPMILTLLAGGESYGYALIQEVK